MQAIVVRLFFRMDGTYVLTYLRTQSNLRTSLPCTTSLVVAGSKAYRNDQLWKTSVQSHLVKHIYITLSFVQDTPSCQSRGWLCQPRVGKTSVQTSAVDRHYKSWGFSENVERGIGENVGTVATPQYAMERKFVERYSKKMSGKQPKN